MSNYTTRVRYICESEAGREESSGFNDIENILTAAIPKVFNFDFPIFDEEYRSPLLRKILRHYYMREICAETVGYWKLLMENKLNEIMPYYNQLYKSALLEFDPLLDTDLHTTRDGSRGNVSHSATNGSTVGHGADTENRKETINSSTTTDGTVDNSNSNENETSGTDWTLFNNTPQGGLDGIETWKYLTTATKQTNESQSSGSFNGTETSHGVTDSEGENDTIIGRERENTVTENKETNSEATTTEQYLMRIYGRKGGKTGSELLMEFRKTFVNVDAMIIKDLEPLFFGLWE